MTTMSTAAAPAAGTYTVHVHGYIVAIKSATEFQIQGGPGVGYLNVYTNSSTVKYYNGLTPAVGRYADVYGNGSTSTYVNATQITLTSSATASSSATPVPGSYSVHVHGNITALISSTEFQLQGGTGVGYVHVYVTSSTVKNYNGLTPKAGVYADVYANGTLSTGNLTATQLTLSSTSSGSGGSATPAPSAPSGSTSITHVMTAGIYGYGGTSTAVSPASMAPYLSWAQTDPSHAATLRSHGIKVDVYMNFWKNYTSDNPTIGYHDLEPGGAHASAEVKTCSGVVAHESIYGGGYVANAMSSAAGAHAAIVANYREGEYSGNYDALFSDDTGSLDGDPLPCGYTVSAYKADTNAVHASLGKKLFINGLNAGSDIVSQVDYTSASNVLGGMCESCLSYWARNAAGTVYDAVRQTDKWVADENVEALMVARHKIYWAYARAIGDASRETGLRLYTYASFLLTYDPNYAMMQESLKTPSGFEVFPETGLVALQPLTTSSNVSGYLRSGGAYMREFSACYYRGSARGKCAVVVNPSYTTSARIPTTAYRHAMALSGYGVLDGGSASFAAAAPASLAPGTAAILFQ